MHCVVYVLREAGKKLPRDVVQSRPYPGWLFFGDDSRKFYPRAVARLFDTERTRVDVIEPLIHASIKKIENGGILIYGASEAVGYQQPDPPQVWWCMPAPPVEVTPPPHEYRTTPPSTVGAP